MVNRTVLKIEGITKKIKDRTIVDNISFDIKETEIVGLIGRNGAGKTTTTKMVLGLTNMDSGNVIINNFNLKTQFEQAIASIGGFVDIPAFYKYMTAYQNLSLFVEGKFKNKRIDEVLKIVGLFEARNKKVKGYSFGMNQRLGIAQAIIHKPQILILDEPTNGLDPSGVIEIRDYLLKVSKEENVAILISSHNLYEIQKICNRILWINNGRLLGESNVSEIEDIENEYIKYSGGEIV